MLKASLVRTSTWPRIAAFAAIFLGPLPCDGEAVVLTDDFSTGIHGWTYADDLDGSTDAEPGAVMSWDLAEGNPDPGSLVLSAVEVSTRVEGYWALGPCMDSLPYEVWQTQAMVKKTGSALGHCRAYVSLFASPGCAGEGTVTGTNAGAPPIAPDVWHASAWEIQAHPTRPWARTVLFMSVSPGTVITCHFDSVVVTNDRGVAATDVPALSAVSLVILASVLAAIAVARLARRRIA